MHVHMHMHMHVNLCQTISEDTHDGEEYYLLLPWKLVTIPSKRNILLLTSFSNKIQGIMSDLQSDGYNFSPLPSDIYPKEAVVAIKCHLNLPWNVINRLISTQLFDYGKNNLKQWFLTCQSSKRRPFFTTNATTPTPPSTFSPHICIPAQFSTRTLVAGNVLIFTL